MDVSMFNMFMLISCMLALYYVYVSMLYVSISNMYISENVKYIIKEPYVVHSVLSVKMSYLLHRLNTYYHLTITRTHRII